MLMNYNDWVDNAVAITRCFPLGTKEIITEVKLYYTPKNSTQRFEKTINALWDTGAQCSVISKVLESEFNLEIVSTQTVTGVSCIPEDANVYVVDLSFHQDMIIKDIKVVATGNDSRFSMIIGMDIIREGDFSLGTITKHPTSGILIDPVVLFSFANPSSGTPTDYVNKIMRSRNAKDQSPKNLESRKEYQAKKAKKAKLKKQKKRRK